MNPCSGAGEGVSMGTSMGMSTSTGTGGEDTGKGKGGRVASSNKVRIRRVNITALGDTHLALLRACAWVWRTQEDQTQVREFLQCGIVHGMLGLGVDPCARSAATTDAHRPNPLRLKIQTTLLPLLRTSKGHGRKDDDDTRPLPTPFYPGPGPSLSPALAVDMPFRLTRIDPACVQCGSRGVRRVCGDLSAACVHVRCRTCVASGTCVVCTFIAGPHFKVCDAPVCATVLKILAAEPRPAAPEPSTFTHVCVLADPQPVRAMLADMLKLHTGTPVCVYDDDSADSEALCLEWTHIRKYSDGEWPCVLLGSVGGALTPALLQRMSRVVVIAPAPRRTRDSSLPESVRALVPRCHGVPITWIQIPDPDAFLVEC